MYEQRAEKSTERFEPRGPWQPSGLQTISGSLAQRASTGPWYVAVDELHDTWCRVVIDGWPDVDADGRLVFLTEHSRLEWLNSESVHSVIREARAADAETEEARASADRPLRIGDVFAVWPRGAERLGIAPEPASTGSRPAGSEHAAELVDVTAAARVAARAAMDAVGAGELTEGDLGRLGIPDSAVEPPAAV